MPEEKVRVLGFLEWEGYQVQIIHKDGDVFRSDEYDVDFGEFYQLCSTTSDVKWMPLPEPPKQESL